MVRKSSTREFKRGTPLSITHPELAKEADGWDPSRYSMGSEEKLTWKCKEFGDVWVASITSRARKIKPTGCPICVGQKVLVGRTDLLTLVPELAAQAFGGWDPSTVGRGNGILRWWQCPIDPVDIWQASVNTRYTMWQERPGSGCGGCVGLRLYPGNNDLATTHPELSKQAFGWDPSKFTKGSHKKKTWVCVINPEHKWEAAIYSRTGAIESGCPICANKKILIGDNDLATTHKDVAAECDGTWDPQKFGSGSHEIMWWRCKEYNHHFKAEIKSRALYGSGCSVCDGKVVLAGFNDLKSKFPDIAAQAFGWDPTTIHFGSQKRLKFKCIPLGHISPSSAADRVRGFTCKFCTPAGFDNDKPGYLYLMRHEKWGMLQVGISNSAYTRVEQHTRRGWALVDLIGPFEGLVIRQTETKILRMLRASDTKVKMGKNKASGRFDGMSEAWAEESFHITSLDELIDLATK